jgi:hypothetical protein
MISTIPRYQIFDSKEKKFVSALYKDRKRARSRADKLDLEYGAIRYQVKEVNP